MNLPHLQHQSHKPASVGKASLGPASLRALTRPVRSPPRYGRVTIPTEFYTDIEELAVLPDPSHSWRTLEVERKNLLNLPYQRMVQIALDLSPNVNKGFHDFLRFANPGVFMDGSDRAMTATQQFIRQMDRYYGSFKSHLDSIWAGIFITGGAFLELILDKGGRAPLDIAANNPNVAKFRRIRQGLRGRVWELGQGTLLEFNSLANNPLVKYIGFDRLVDNPYGRPLIGPSVHASLFLLGLISELRRMIVNQGITRLDYELQAEELLSLIDRNPDIAGDDAATAQFIEEQIELVQAALEGLDVDSDYVHLSTVKVNYATNPTSLNMTGIDQLVENLRIDVINGFKGIASLNNILTSTTETHGNLQVDYLVSAIQSLQDEVASIFKEFFDVGNQVQGIRSDLIFAFKRQRAYDRKQFAEFVQIETETILKKLEAGVITVQEARAEIDALKDELSVS